MKSEKSGWGWIILGASLLLGALALTSSNLLTQYQAAESTNEVLPELLSTTEKREEEQPAQTEIEIDTRPLYVQNPDMEMPVETIDGYDYIGVLEIPVLGLTLPIMSEWDEVGMNKTPCRYRGSAYLDNMILCAHYFPFHFGNLRNLQYGDEVRFTDIDGNVFCYQVIDQEIIQPYAMEDMLGGDWDLTLFTCTLSATSRQTVRCKRIEP